MAARLRPSHQEDVKAKIQATQLVNFLQNHALDGKKVVDSTRIDAAKFLLNKVLSNAPTEIAGEGGGAVRLEVSWTE